MSSRNFKGLPDLCGFVHPLSGHRAVGVDQADLDVLAFQEGVFVGDSRVCPAASIPIMCPTAIRRLRTMGLPPRTSGRTVIRLSRSSPVAMRLSIPDSFLFSRVG